MGSTPTTVLLDDEVLAGVRSTAARDGVDDAAVIERAVRRYLDLEVIERIWTRNVVDPISPDDAMKLAYEELRASRAE